LESAVEGASAVLIQLRVGGQAARLVDETLPNKFHLLGQETTGPGGFAKALRTVPVVLDIAEVVRERGAPGVWIVDFTNPVGIVTRALLDAGHRAIGLCNVAIGFQRRWAALLGVEPSEVVLDHVGLNHLTWERGVYVDGVDRLPELMAGHLADLAAEVEIPAEVLSTLDCVPSYYLRYFYCHDEVVREERGRPTRGQKVAEIEAQLLDMYGDPTLDTKPELLGQRGGAFYSEAAVGLIASLRSGDGVVHSANVRNEGYLPFLPDDAVIEASCRVDKDGARPVPTSPLGPSLSGLIAHVSGYEELAVTAAVHGGRSRVYQAMLAHPLIGQHDLATQLTDKLLAANAAYLAWK
jgi:6-phospho-beta-glucosidase